MRTDVSNNSLSNVDKIAGITLAAFSMFVVGYTATRAFLSQPQNTTATSVNADIVIPHEATLWSDLGK